MLLFHIGRLALDIKWKHSSKLNVLEINGKVLIPNWLILRFPWILIKTSDLMLLSLDSRLPIPKIKFWFKTDLSPNKTLYILNRRLKACDLDHLMEWIKVDYTLCTLKTQHLDRSVRMTKTIALKPY